MKNFMYIVGLFALLLSSSVFAQNVPSVQWGKCFGGRYADIAHSVQQTTDGGYIIAGSSASSDGDINGWHIGYDNGRPLPDFWIVKLDSAGNLVWQKSLGGSGVDEAESIQQTSDNGFIVAGFSSSHDGDVLGNKFARTCWVVKLDTSGNIKWQKCLGGSNLFWSDPYHSICSIHQTSDHGFIVMGDPEYQVRKLDSLGNIQWQRSLGDNYNAFSGVQTIDNAIIVAGYQIYSHSRKSYWISKFDMNGNIIWQEHYGGNLFDIARSIQQTKDGGFIIAGYSNSNLGDFSGNQGAHDYYILKLNENGDMEWQTLLGGSSDDKAFSIEQTQDGGFIIAGGSSSTDGEVSGHHGPRGKSDFWIVKLKDFGYIEWQKCLGGSKDDGARSIQQTKDGGFIIAGSSQSTDGDVTGHHRVQSDYWIVKLSPEIITSTPLQVVNSVSVYPNPTLAQLTIHLSFPSNESTVSVYDVQGRNMNGEYIIDDFTSGNSIQLNKQDLPAGFYTIQITNKKNGQMEIGKFVKE